MIKNIYLKVIVLQLACLWLSSCASTKVTGAVEGGRTQSQGPTTATLSRKGGPPKVVTVGDVLNVGDALETRSGYIHIKFDDGSRVVVYPNSRIRISSFFLDFGKALVEALGAFRTQTPDAAIDVEGTQYIVERGRGQQATDVTVLEGGVFLSPQPGVGNWPRTIVKATGRCTVGKEYQRFHPRIDKRRFDKLVLDSNRLLKRFEKAPPRPHQNDFGDGFPWSPLPPIRDRPADDVDGRRPDPGGLDPGKRPTVTPPPVFRQPIRPVRVPNLQRFRPKPQRMETR